MNNGNNGVLTQFFFETIFPNYKENELVLVDNYIIGKLPCVVPTWIGILFSKFILKYKINNVGNLLFNVNLIFSKGKDKKFIDDFVNRVLKKKSEETLQIILELIIEGL